MASAGWFDGERSHQGPITVQVRAGRIAERSAGDHGATLQAQGMAVERGGFLMPGLIDAHVHLLLDGQPTDGATRSAHTKQSVEQLTEAARRSARQSLRHGVTWVRDAGDRYGVNDRIRAQARATAADLAQVRSAGVGLKRPNRYGALIGADVGNEADIRAAVAERCARADEIKIVLTGLIDFEQGEVTDEPQFTLAETALIVDTACRHGRRTLAHCSGPKGLRIAAEAGVGSIEHGFFMNREILQRMRDRAVAWTPTFCPVYFQWAVPGAAGWSANTVGHLRRILDQHLQQVALAHRLGVELLLGTDAGSMGVEHGKAVLQEIGYYREAGVPLEAALKAATLANRRHLDLEDMRFAPGQRFEALLLRESPFVRLETLADPQRVWVAAPA